MNAHPRITVAGGMATDLMIEKGQSSIDAAHHQNPIFKSIKLVLPHVTFKDGELSLRVGKKNLVLFATPGHSLDGISILVEEDRVLFAGDAFLPLPYVVDGDLELGIVAEAAQRTALRVRAGMRMAMAPDRTRRESG